MMSVKRKNCKTREISKEHGHRENALDDRVRSAASDLTRNRVRRSRGCISSKDIEFGGLEHISYLSVEQ